MLLVDDLAAGGTKNLRHTPRGLVTLKREHCLLDSLLTVRQDSLLNIASSR